MFYQLIHWLISPSLSPCPSASPPTRPCPATCPATVPRSFPATPRATVPSPGTCCPDPRAAAAWPAPSTTVPWLPHPTQVMGLKLYCCTWLCPILYVVHYFWPGTIGDKVPFGTQLKTLLLYFLALALLFFLALILQIVAVLRLYGFTCNDCDILCWYIFVLT